MLPALLAVGLIALPRVRFVRFVPEVKKGQFASTQPWCGLISLTTEPAIRVFPQRLDLINPLIGHDDRLIRIRPIVRSANYLPPLTAPSFVLGLN